MKFKAKKLVVEDILREDTQVSVKFIDPEDSSVFSKFTHIVPKGEEFYGFCVQLTPGQVISVTVSFMGSECAKDPQTKKWVAWSNWDISEMKTLDKIKENVVKAKHQKKVIK